MAKPDDRSDNVEKLQKMIHNTQENLQESRDFLKAHGDEMATKTKKELSEKNGRREESIRAFRQEIGDELTYKEPQR